MGRITPEKEVETVVAILDRVRAAGHAVTLDLAGHFASDGYSAKIRAMAEERKEWIRLTGFLDPRKKEELFSTRSFGIHACRVEAFGIAVAEMAASGLIPFVPAEGGVGEIVGRDELIFRHADDAVEKICRMIESPKAREGLRKSLRSEVARFRPERFAENLVGIVQDFIGQPLAHA
jgi:glycosyltransferase involved in cell wall biosynthesis